jgi:hypothetical protein
MAVALLNSDTQELVFAVPSRKLGLEARFCISRLANGLNGGTGRVSRYAQGVKLRREIARQNHADLLGAADRDPVAILAAGDRTRLPI